MTGCGCLLLVGVIVGLIAFMLFGSTDPGEPVEQLVGLLVLGGMALVPLRVLGGMALVPLRRALVSARRA